MRKHYGNPNTPTRGPIFPTSYPGAGRTERGGTLTIERTDEGTTNLTEKAMGWKTFLWNDDVNTFDHVILTLQKVVHCKVEEANKMALIVHTEGKAVVYEGHRERCEAVAEALNAYGLNATIAQ